MRDPVMGSHGVPQQFICCMSHRGMQITLRNLKKTRLLVELVCKDTEGLSLKRVTRHLFLQLALHNVSKRKVQKWHFRCFGHMENEFFQ